MSSSHESAIVDFSAITGAEPSVAKAFLRACSWDQSTAVNRYFEFDGDISKLAPPSSSSSAPPSNLSNNAAPQHPQGVMNSSANAIASFFGYGGVAAAPPQSAQPVHSAAIPHTASSSQQSAAFLSQEDRDAALARQLMQQDAQPMAADADFVRAPDQVRTDRLVGPYVNQFGSSRFQQQRDLQQNFAKDWQKGPRNAKSGYLGKLFSDPEWRFKGDLEAAKQKGARENKWLLINIQDTENFTSHCLNRDVWKDKELGPVIQASFVFYQWIRSTDTAKRIVNLYRPTAFPCILVVDPSTGRQDYEFAVPEAPDKVVTLKSKLLEFLDDYPNPKVKPKMKGPAPVAPQGMTPHLSHDDKLLQEALAASMADSGAHSDSAINSNHNGDAVQMDDEQKDAATAMEVESEEQVAAEQKLEDLLEAQPEASDANATAIRIRMPSGGVLQRLFKKDALVRQLYIWSRLSVDGAAVSLLQTMPRLHLDDQQEKTLRELGLERATLVCSLKEE